jgi:hypothetical protein
MELIAGAARPIPIEQARAREQLWTPAKERAELAQLEGAQESEREVAQETRHLWTPTDQRSAS